MTSELQQNRYDQLIRRVGGIIGPGSKVSEALTELFPVIDVERVPGELLLLGGTKLCQGAAQVTGAAGQAPKVQVFNPTGSGAIVTVTTLIATSLGVDTHRIATTNTVLTTNVATEVFRDRRLPITSTPVADINTESAVAATDSHILSRNLANVRTQLEDENGLAVLPPGSGYECGSSVFAAVLLVSFLWRERPAERSELEL